MTLIDSIRDIRDDFEVLEDENERLRDMLNDVPRELGLEGVRYFSDDNYEECHETVMNELRKRLMPPGFEWTDAFADAVDFMDCIHDLLYTIDGDEHTSEEMFADIMKRLTPRGYEWPRYTDTGELLKYGDVYIGNDGNNHRAWHIRFDSNANVYVLYGDLSNGPLWDYFDKGERVKRPAPAVLAADGEPLEVGQTVWVAENGNRFHVVRLCDDGLVQGTLNGYLMNYLKPDQLTHQRPVLDADGVPIREGDTVWFVGGGEPAEVAYTITADASHPDEVDEEIKKRSDYYWEKDKAERRVKELEEENERLSKKLSKLKKRCKALAGVSE